MITAHVNVVFKIQNLQPASRCRSVAFAFSWKLGTALGIKSQQQHFGLLFKYSATFVGWFLCAFDKVREYPIKPFKMHLRIVSQLNSRTRINPVMYERTCGWLPGNMHAGRKRRKTTANKSPTFRNHHKWFSTPQNVLLAAETFTFLFLYALPPQFICFTVSNKLSSNMGQLFPGFASFLQCFASTATTLTFLRSQYCCSA